ncbi:hypothetical protein J4G33_04495 [Actinotalea sp. BY-33]|uniref:Uncharacterized protein n=1 Tax=Actinotalea soli TaxID=2819234 RepID=A0A939RSF6_9CELL|nr:hypothetical protein [Actinotalea soli]MBO1751057.1 hypothetical protein [Actinotalea soli]
MSPGVVDRLRALLRMTPRPGVEPAVPPAPEVRLDLAVAVPGALVRLVPAAAMLGAMLLAGPGPVGVTFGLGAAAAVTWWPGSPAAPVFLLLVALWVFSGPDLLAEPAAGGAETVRAALLVLAVHLVLRGAALAQHVGWRSLVEGRLLARIGRSVLAVQVVAQVMLLAVVWVRSGLGGPGPGQGWVRLVAVAAAVAVVVLLVPGGWLRRRPNVSAE